MNSSCYGFQVLYSGDLLEYTVENLIALTQYEFRVKASNRQGDSNFSPVLVCKTLSPLPILPSVPRLAKKAEETCLHIRWDSPSNCDANSYQLEISNPGTDAYALVYSGADNFFSPSGLEPGTNYPIRVRALNSSGNSPWMENSVATAPIPPDPPRNLTWDDSKTTCNSIYLQWDPPLRDGGSKISKYAIYKKTCAEILEKISETGPTLNFSLTDLLPGTQYDIQISAMNACGEGFFSNTLQVSTRASVPEKPNLAVVRSKCNSIR
eukprot:Sdes_comp16511_c0_seq1m5826